MKKPLILRLYLLFSLISAPLWYVALRLLARRGRIDGSRLGEYFGHASQPRPPGPLLWLHAVSVGESLALLTLLRRLHDRRPDVALLLTTSTPGAARAIRSAGLPAGVIHQYTPVDTPLALRRFLAHWAPTAVVIAEVDLWPATLQRLKAAGLPLLMLNAVLGDRRWRRWQRRPGVHLWLLAQFDRVLLQDDISRQRIAAIGLDPARSAVMGVLKAASDPLADLPDARLALEAALGTRPRWLAASTKSAEEPQLLAAHHLALARCPDLLLVLAPRQVQLADETERQARTLFAHVARRSRGEAPGPQTQVYLADTIGEMGLWYRLCPLSFIGNSLTVPGHEMTGKNPFEAVALESVVLHGPEIGSFVETYRQLQAAGAACEVADAAELAQAVCAGQAPEWRAPYLAGAARVLAENQRPLQMALDAVMALLPPR